MQGVDSAWVADEIAEGYHFTAGDESKVPLLVSRKVLQAYNLGFAAANRLPRLSEKAVVGQEVSVSLGASSLAGSAFGAIVRPGVVVGFSDRIDALGVAVPIELIASVTQRLTGEALNAYDEAILVGTSPKELPRIEAAVRKLGFQITPESQIPKQVGGAITAATVVLSAIGLVVVGLALANIANTLALILGERRYELAVVRAVGVSERLLRALLVGEAVVAGFLAAIVALAASWLALQIGARSLSGVLESLTGAAPRFPIPAALVLGVLVGTPIASFIAALVPAIRVTAPSIATALRR
jgi:putative ABC transport system permease protein